MDATFSAQFAGFLAENKEKLLPTKLISALASIARFDAWRLIAVDADGTATVIDFRNTLPTDGDTRGRDIGPDPICRIAEQCIGDGFHRSHELAPRGLMKTAYYKQARRHGLVLVDHAGFVATLGHGKTLCLSISRSDLFSMFTEAENDRLRAVSPLVVHGLKTIGSEMAPIAIEGAHRPPEPEIDVRDLIVQGFGSGILSARESDVAKLLFEGQSAKAIARSLGISPGTVRNHIKHIYLKLRLNSRGEFYSRCLGELARTRAA